MRSILIPTHGPSPVMGMACRLSSAIAQLSLVALGLPPAIQAQIIPDGTLNSTLSADPNRSIVQITGGTRANTNLFHSFDQFSVLNGQTVEFSPDAGVQTIITRVTGTAASRIDGRLRTPGNVNLVLLNPHGIDFGPNASLEVNGSFWASTAPALNFADGVIFSTNRADPPLLSVNLPVGIQRGPRPLAAIANAGTLAVGQNLTLSAGLISSSGTVTAGGDMTFMADTLTLDQAKLQVGPNPMGANPASGNIDIRANVVDIRNGSQLITAPSALGQSGNITVQPLAGSAAIGSQVTLSGRGTGLFTAAATGMGRGGTIAITSDRVILADYAQINALTLGRQRGGDILINSRNFTATSGAKIATNSFGTGAAGDIQINASDRLTVTGTNVVNPATALLFNAVLTGDGLSFLPGTPTTSGALIITQAGSTFSFTPSDIQRLSTVQTGIEASSYGRGNSGSLSLNAAAIDITTSSYISVSNWATGNAGNVVIDADRLHLERSAILATSILGKGATLNLNARQVTLDYGVLLAATVAGQGGNVNLNVGDYLLLRNNSQITARAFTISNGGNIQFQGGFIIAPPQQSNDISAGALQGNGGTIQITAQSILGLVNRPTLTPLNDINASSQFGTNGNVAIVSPTAAPNRGTVQLPTDLIDALKQITQTCSVQAHANGFVVTGRGGLPPSPQEVLNAAPGWIDSMAASTANADPPPVTRSAPTDYQEATAWTIDAAGTVTLVAASPAVTPQFLAIACQTAPAFRPAPDSP